MDQAELYQGILRYVSSPSVTNNVIKTESIEQYDSSKDNIENHCFDKNSIILEDDEDVPDSKKYRSIRDLIVFKEDPEDISKNNNDVSPKRMMKDVTGTINLLDIKNQTNNKVKAEPSRQFEANLGYHRSFRDSIVFKDDHTSDLYNNHTFKEEMVNNEDEMVINDECTFDLYTDTFEEELGNKNDTPSDLYNNHTFKEGIVNKDDVTYDLYKNHTFKEEMVIGPEVIQHSVYPQDEISKGNNELVNKNNICNKQERVKQHSCKCGKKYSSKMWFSRHSCDMVFICDFCNKQFDAKYKIKHHMKRHMLRRIKRIRSLPYYFDHECNLCPKKFGLKASLDKHIKIIHENEDPNTVDGVHKCHICSKVFTLIGNLKRHLEIHLGTAKKTFRCETCAKTYRSNESLRNHIISEHDGVFKIQGQLQNQILSKQPIKCSYCRKTFTHRSNCNKHTKYFCLSNPNVNKINMTCDICKKTYYHKPSLIDHMMVHMGLTPKSYKRPAVQCDLCEKTFSRKTSLKRHMESVHLKFRKHTCKFCNSEYTRRWVLREHENKCQGMKKSFRCSICSKEFNSKIRLGWHKESQHYDVIKSTMICCELCPKVYKNKTGLKLHMEAKHKKNCKQFSCKKCKTGFTRKWWLQCHEKKCLSSIQPSNP